MIETNGGTSTTTETTGEDKRHYIPAREVMALAGFTALATVSATAKFKGWKTKPTGTGNSLLYRRVDVEEYVRTRDPKKSRSAQMGRGKVGRKKRAAIVELDVAPLPAPAVGSAQAETTVDWAAATRAARNEGTRIPVFFVTFRQLREVLEHA